MAQEPIFTIGELAKIECKPGQKFVVHTDRILSAEQVEEFRRFWNDFMPGYRVMILDAGIRLGVIEESMEIVSDGGEHF